MKWQSMNGHYNGDQLAAMQKDAMDRVREMQRRADETLRRSNADFSPPMPEEPPLPPPSAPPPPPLSVPSAPCKEPMGKLEQLLSTAGIDRDRIVILALLLLLYNDGADQLLLLALLYLFL